MVRVISKEDVAQLLEMPATVDAVDKAFRLSEDAIVPDRTQIKPKIGNGETFVMPGILVPSDMLGVKTVTIYPSNDERGIPRTLGTILLHDDDTGTLESIIDGSLITNYRTGAIGAVAARYLSPRAVETAAVIGASTQARYQILALDSELDLRTVRIYSRSNMKDELVEDLSPEVDVNLSAVDSPTEACEDAGIIVTATSSPEPVFPSGAIRSDALVIGIGSNDPDMREIPGEIIGRAREIYVDDYKRCIQVGDLADAISEGELTEAQITPFGQYLREEPSDRPDGGISVLKSVGSIVFDIHVGNTVLKDAKRESVGTVIDIQGIDQEELN